jgi:hypothetical protein
MMLFYSRRGYKKHLVGRKERWMEKPEGVKGDGNCQ